MVTKKTDNTKISITSNGKSVETTLTGMETAIETIKTIDKKKFDEAGFEVKDKTEDQKYKFTMLFKKRDISTIENKDGIMVTTYSLKLQGHDLPSAENTVTQKMTLEFEDLDWFKDTFGIEFDNTGQIEMNVTIGRANKTLDEFGTKK